jgi:light-regulated signal transduction histidine kinase (bacteriophytochrome)
MSLLAEDKGISVSCEAKPGITVEGDRARLKQVVVNLLDNAIKYTPTGGAIHLGVTRKNGHAVLDVTDNGIGIPARSLAPRIRALFPGGQSPLARRGRRRARTVDREIHLHGARSGRGGGKLPRDRAAIFASSCRWRRAERQQRKINMKT